MEYVFFSFCSFRFRILAKPGLLTWYNGMGDGEGLWKKGNGLSQYGEEVLTDDPKVMLMTLVTGGGMKSGMSASGGR